jgi:hypothetical protein
MRSSRTSTTGTPDGATAPPGLLPVRRVGGLRPRLPVCTPPGPGRTTAGRAGGRCGKGAARPVPSRAAGVRGRRARRPGCPFYTRSPCRPSSSRWRFLRPHRRRPARPVFREPSSAGPTSAYGAGLRGGVASPWGCVQIAPPRNGTSSRNFASGCRPTYWGSLRRDRAVAVCMRPSGIPNLRDCAGERDGR